MTEGSDSGHISSAIGYYNSLPAKTQYWILKCQIEDGYFGLRYEDGKVFTETNLEQEEATKIFMDQIGNRCCEFIANLLKQEKA